MKKGPLRPLFLKVIARGKRFFPGRRNRRAAFVSVGKLSSPCFLPVAVRPRREATRAPETSGCAFQTENAPGSVNNIPKLFGGKGNPSALLSMPVASFVATGTACGRHPVAAGARGPAFPAERRSRSSSPQAPIPSPARFFRGAREWQAFAANLYFIEVA